MMPDLLLGAAGIDRSVHSGIAPMRGETWDLFVGDGAAGALWLGWSLAAQLAESGERVRLFVEQMPLLARRVTGIDGHLELQHHAGVTICRSDRAAGAWPASTVLQVLGATMPSSYLHRLLNHPGATRWLQLESLEGARSATTPLTPLDTHLACRSFLVQLGDAPQHGGFLRLPRPTAGVGFEGLSKKSLQRSDWLQRLGLSGLDLSERFTIFVDACAGLVLGPLLSHWEAQGENFCVVLESPVSAYFTASDGRMGHDKTGAEGISAVGPQVIGLPLWTWADTDALLRSVDLALIGDSVSCIRVASLGIPLVPLMPKPLEDDALVQWYCDGGSHDVKESIGRISQWNGSPEDLPTLWDSYILRWEAMIHHAQRVADRIAGSADLTETVLERKRSTSSAAWLSA